MVTGLSVLRVIDTTPYIKPRYRKNCNVKNIVHELPVKLWNVDTKFCRTGKFINHPENLPTILLNID